MHREWDCTLESLVPRVHLVVEHIARAAHDMIHVITHVTTAHGAVNFSAGRLVMAAGGHHAPGCALEGTRDGRSRGFQISRR